MTSSQARRARRKQFASTQASGTIPSLHRYKRLPTSTSIRILELLPLSEELECTLEIVDLNEQPLYDAISYCWANPVVIRERPINAGHEQHDEIKSLLSMQKFPTERFPDTINVDPGAFSMLTVHNSLPYIDKQHARERNRSIKCEGKTIGVTETLYIALQQLRTLADRRARVDALGLLQPEDVPRARRLWIDQVCINQDDLDERNAQVSLMNRIFASACYVFAYLGDLDALGMGGLQVATARGLNKDSRTKSDHGTQSYEQLGTFHQELYALTALLSRQWFRRAWVVQEAVFAKHMFVFLENIFIDWWVLLGAIESLREKDVMNMASFMGSLLRREPTGRMSRKLSKLENGYINPLQGIVPSDEVSRYVTGTISFMRGINQIKKKLGFRTPVVTVKVTENILDLHTQSQFLNLITGTLLLPDGKVRLPPNDPTSLPIFSCAHGEDTQEGYHNLKKEECRKLTHDNLMERLLSRSARSKPLSDPCNLLQVRKFAYAAFFHHNFSMGEPSQPEPISLLYLISQFRDVGASDPRDKVFAFLHMCTEVPGLKPDYRATVQTVYTSAAEFFFSSRDLTILSHVQDPEDTRIDDLPSWVPDFSVPLGKSPFVAHDGSSPYNACGNFLVPPMMSLMIEEPRTMRRYEVFGLMSYYLDTIEELEPQRGCSFVQMAKLAMKTPKHYAKQPGPMWCKKSQIVFRLAMEPGMPRVEALWRTLIGDYCTDTYPANMDAGFGFSEWVITHIHHSFHIESMLHDHFAAVGLENARSGFKQLAAKQKEKLDMFLQLHAEDFGGYRCHDCTTELWKRKVESFDKTLMKQFNDMGITPAMSPVRYMPDADRMSATKRCNRTIDPRIEPEHTMQCPPITNVEHKRLSAFENRMREVRTGRRMFRTKGNLLGMGPKSSRPGDEVWIVAKGKVPFVLRPVHGGKEPKRYTLVGECYVLGYMDGEILQEGRECRMIGLM